MNTANFTAALSLVCVGLCCSDQTSTDSPSDLPSEEACEAIEEPAPARLTASQYKRVLTDLFQTDDGQMLPVIAQASTPVGVSQLQDRWRNGYPNQADAQEPTDADLRALLRNAVLIAEEVAALRQQIAGGLEAGTEEEREYIAQLARRAWRLPVNGPSVVALLEWYDADLGLDDPDRALPAAIAAILLAPELFYQLDATDAEGCPVDPPVTDHRWVTRMSLALWGTYPDPNLLELADSGRVEAEFLPAFEEISADRRTLDGLGDFAQHWLELPDAVGSRLTPGGTPIDDETGAALVTQARQFVAETIRAGGTVRDLFQSSIYPVRADVAEYYGLAPGDFSDTWEMVDVATNERTGLATLAGVLAEGADEVRPSPVRRANLILTRVICSPPPPPPANLDTTLEVVDTGGPQTVRQRYDIHQADPVCSSCHAVMDPLGHAFGNFNSSGEFWAEEPWWPNDVAPSDAAELVWLPIDSETRVVDYLPEPLGGLDVSGAADIADALADSEAVHRCFVSNLLQWTLGRELDSDNVGDQELAQRITELSFTDDVPVTSLLADVFTSDQFRSRGGAP